MVGRRGSLERRASCEGLALLDYEDDAGMTPRVHVEANDPEGLNDTLLLTVNLSNVNDNDPVFDGSSVRRTSRGS